MPITDITNKILADAAKEADKVAAGAEQEVQEIEKRLEVAKKEITDKYEKYLEKTLSENEKRVASAAHQEVKLQIDKAKRGAINEIFNNSLGHLFSLSNEDYGAMLKGLLSPLPKDMQAEVTAPKEKVAITKKILSELKMKNLVTPTDKFQGGVIITGSNFEYDLTFKNLLTDKKSSLEVGVAKILFT